MHVTPASRNRPPRVAVVTGGGAGIGRHLALQLASAGSAIALVDNNPDALEQTATDCRALGARVAEWKLDVSDLGAVAELGPAVAAELGTPDALYNVAGIIMAGTLVDSDMSDIQHVIAVDLLGVIATCHTFLPYLEASGRGRLVNVSSAFGLIGVSGYSAYNAAKFGVRGFSEALMQEVSSRVTVSCALLGGVRTDIMRNGRYSPNADAAAIQARFDERIARTSPSQAAAVILRQSGRGRRRILVGCDARLADTLARITGAGYQVFTRNMGSGRT